MRRLKEIVTPRQRMRRQYLQQVSKWKSLGKPESREKIAVKSCNIFLALK